MRDQCCNTCHHYNNPDSKYECQYWEECCAENTCSEWKEGYHTHNLLFRIVALENALSDLETTLLLERGYED